MGSPTTWVLFSVPQHPTEREKEAWRGRQIKKRVFFSTKADEPKAGPFSPVNVGPFRQNLVPRRLVSFLLFSKTNKGKLFFRWPEGPQCFHTKHPWGQIPSESKKVRYLNTKADKATSHKSDLSPVNVGPFRQSLVPRRLVSFLLFSKTNKQKLFFGDRRGLSVFTLSILGAKYLQRARR